MKEKKTETNPNKVNQHTAPDPRQKLFLSNYLNPKSTTFSNAYQSALKAGYGEEYAKNILNQETDWLSETLDDDKMLRKAENVLDEMLDMPVVISKVDISDGEPKEVVKTEPALVKVKQDTAKFVAERRGKDRWSNRTEVTGAGGKDLIPTKETKEEISKVIDEYLKK